MRADFDTLSGLVEYAGIRAFAPKPRLTPTSDDYWISQGGFDHYTLPMSLQCRLFPRTTLGVKPPRDKGVTK